MKFDDPQMLRVSQPKDSILFAATQLPGHESQQEDCFVNFNDECFVVTDGGAGLPHGDVAARLAGETALWGYKHIRQHKFYWLDKKLFMKRIFRSANLAVWQKRREQGFEEGLATTLLVAMVGPRSCWVGSAGDTQAFLWRDGAVQKLIREDLDHLGRLTKAVGFVHFGLIPQFVASNFGVGDALLLVTSGAGNYLLEQEIALILSGAGENTERMKEAVTELVAMAQVNGSEKNMTACLIKRVGVG